MPRLGLKVLTLVVAGFAAPAGAQPLAPIAPLAPDSGPPLGTTPITPARSSDRPPPVLGAPVGVGDRSTPAPPPVAPVAFTEAPPAPKRAAGFGAPSPAPSAYSPVPAASATPVPAALVDDALARTAYNPPSSDPVEFLNKRSELRAREASEARAGGPKPKYDVEAAKFGEGLTDKLGAMIGDNNGAWFRSDHMFDGFISPVTNPFLFEDPRSLTEVRPIFIYQRVPTGQPDFRGGNISFFGTQARVAITDRWSLVMNKLGGVSVNPNDASPFKDEVGFAELWIGPKWTFWRGEETGTLAAAGLQFQLPVGSKAAFQDTGSLSLVPYVSYGQNFLRDFRLGSFNFLASTGYTFSTNNQRTDYYWLSAHLDFDAGNFHRFYPLVEMNWIVNTSNGRSRPMGAEGRDLINFGAAARGAGLLTGAFGARVKLTENAQLGAAFEFPFAGRKDFFRHRFTLDFILRY